LLYASVFKASKGFVVSATLRVVSLRDSVLPPFTSKVLKSIMARAGCMRGLWGYYNKFRSFRPVTIRVLRTLDGKLMYKSASSRKVLKVRRGEELRGSISFFVPEGAPWDSALLSCDEEVDIDFARFAISLEEVSLEDVRELSAGIERGRPFKVLFRTPLLMTTKVMTPPTLSSTKVYRLVERAEKAHRLLPTPSYIASQAMREWIGIVLGERPDPLWPPYGMGRLADLMVAEVDFSLRPVTVVYDEKRRPRGVRGYVIYRPLDRHVAETLDRLLAFAERMGLGRSRSVGFGEVKVLPLRGEGQEGRDAD